MFRIPPFERPHEDFAIWSNGFTDEEIQKIIDIGELREFQKARVGRSDLNTDIRDTDIVWIEPSPETEWIYHRMVSIAHRVNHDKFGFDLDHFQVFQYSKYKLDGHYDWHKDAGPGSERRKLSFVLAMTDPADYEGGELCINTAGAQEKAHCMKIRKGDIVVFPAWAPHIVTPVTSGLRITLVAWAGGPRFK